MPASLPTSEVTVLPPVSHSSNLTHSQPPDSSNTVFMIINEPCSALSILWCLFIKLFLWQLVGNSHTLPPRVLLSHNAVLLPFFICLIHFTIEVAIFDKNPMLWNLPCLCANRYHSYPSPNLPSFMHGILLCSHILILKIMFILWDPAKCYLFHQDFFRPIFSPSFDETLMLHSQRWTKWLII